MMIRVILHYHLHAIQLLHRNHASMVVRKRQWRKRKQQVRRLLQVFVNAVSRTNQEHDVPGETRLQRIGEFHRIHQLAFFGQNNAFVFASRELLLEKSRLLRQGLNAVIQLGFLEFDDFQRLRGTAQALHILFDFIRYKRRTSLTENC